MSDIRRPEFLKNVTPSAPDSHGLSGTAKLRSVSWASAPDEPAGALPMQPLTAPMPPPTVRAAPPPMPSSPGFDALPPLPIPSPLPFAPPIASKPELSPKVEAAIQALRTQGQRLAEQARSDSLEIGLLVARKILERELVTGLEPLFSLIRSAVRRVGEANKTVVKLCPSDVNRVQDANGLDFSIGKVEIVADASLKSGDVVVETEHHTVDGRVDTRLEEIRRELLGTLEA